VEMVAIEKALLQQYVEIILWVNTC